VKSDLRFLSAQEKGYLMMQEIDFDRNPALSDNYERAPRWFVPGYDASHAMAAVLLRDRIGEHGKNPGSRRRGRRRIVGFCTGMRRLDVHRGRPIG